MAIIVLAFIPVFALTGQEGKLFHPLAFTKTFAMAGATILSVTLVPVRARFHRRQGAWRGAQPDHATARMDLPAAAGLALAHRVLTLGLALLVLAGALALTPRIGKEFMPRSMKAT